MSRKPLKAICGGNIVIEGSGDDLRLKFNAHRKKKTGKYEFYEFDMEVGRWVIARLAKQIATMHVRDRERLKRELNRIDFEVEAIKSPEVQQ